MKTEKIIPTELLDLIEQKYTRLRHKLLTHMIKVFSGEVTWEILSETECYELIDEVNILAPLFVSNLILMKSKSHNVCSPFVLVYYVIYLSVTSTDVVVQTLCMQFPRYQCTALSALLFLSKQ